MNPDRSRILMRSPRSAAALIPLAVMVLSSPTSAQTADATPSRAPSSAAPAVPPVKEPPPSAAVETSASSRPEGQTAAAVPLPSSTTPESSTWSLPTILVMCGIGVEVVGAAFAVGSYIAVMNSKSDMDRSVPNVSAWGCREAVGSCGRFEEAFESASTANTVGAVGFSIATVVASSLFFAGALVWRLSPETAAEPKVGLSVQVVPGPGGMVIQGTF